MVRYKIKTRYINRDKLLTLLKRIHPEMDDADFRIVVRSTGEGGGGKLLTVQQMKNDVYVYSAPAKITDEEAKYILPPFPEMRSS